MTGRHHIIAGFCTAACLTTSQVFAQNTAAIPMAGMAVATLLGSLFPDIDTRTSKLGKRMRLTSRIASALFGHRGFLHSPLFVALIWLLCIYLFQRYDIVQYSPIYLGFIAGMLMHLICDMATKGGLPLLYPYTRKRSSISVLESGSKWEFVSLIFIAVLAIVVTVVMINRSMYLSMLY